VLRRWIRCGGQTIFNFLVSSSSDGKDPRKRSFRNHVAGIRATTNYRKSIKSPFGRLKRVGRDTFSFQKGGNMCDLLNEGYEYDLQAPAIMSSGVAANLPRSGRTSHSTAKLPLIVLTRTFVLQENFNTYGKVYVFRLTISEQAVLVDRPVVWNCSREKHSELESIPTNVKRPPRDQSRFFAIAKASFLADDSRARVFNRHKSVAKSEMIMPVRDSEIFRVFSFPTFSDTDTRS